MTSTGLAGVVRPLAGPDRLVRSLAAALVCVAAAAAGHHSAGGSLAPVSVLAVFLGAGTVAWLLSARRVTPGQMTGLLLLCQVCVHLGDSSGEMTMGVGMLAAHLVATAVSVAALARGEALAWHLAQRIGTALAPVRVVALAVTSGPAAPALREPRALHDACLTHSRVERGPPSRSR